MTILLLAQTTMSIDEQPPAAPPLNLLTIPFDLFVLFLRLLLDRQGQKSEAELLCCCCVGRGRVAPSVPEAAQPPADSFAKADKADKHGVRKSLAERAMRQSTRANLQLQTGEQAAKAMFQLREVEAYMTESLNDEVQEGRWRTKLQRDVHKHHQRLMGRMEEQSRRLAQMQRTLDARLDAPMHASRPADISAPHALGELHVPRSPSPLAIRPSPLRPWPGGGAARYQEIKVPGTPVAPRPAPALPTAGGRFDVPTSLPPPTAAAVGGAPAEASSGRYCGVSTTRPASTALGGLARLPPIEAQQPDEPRGRRVMTSTGLAVKYAPRNGYVY